MSGESYSPKSIGKRDSCSLHCWLLSTCFCLVILSVEAKLTRLDACRVQDSQGMVNLAPLQRTDGHPRFVLEESGWNYTFNPCQSYNLPIHDRYSAAGDRCIYVMMCKSQMRDVGDVFYSIGQERSLRFVETKFTAGLMSIPRGRERVQNRESSGHKYAVEEEVIDSRNKTKDLVDQGDEHFPIKQVYANNGELKPVKERSSQPSFTGYRARERVRHKGKRKKKKGSKASEGIIHGEVEHSSQPSTYIDVTSANQTAILTTVPSSSIMSDRGRTPGLGTATTSANTSDSVLHVTRVQLALRFKGIGSLKKVKTYILLSCDPTLVRPDEAVFKKLSSSAANSMYFDLRHMCCCPGGCDDNSVRATSDREVTNSKNESSPQDMIGVEATPGLRHLWLIVVTNVSILLLAIVIAVMCCTRGSISSGQSGTYYSYLPALHSSQYTVHSVESFFPSPSTVTAEQLDYSSPLFVSAKPSMPDNCLVASKDLEVGQRLGGGLFCDTYIGNWKKTPVAAKRITVGVHQNQLTTDDYDWIVKNISHLGKQRHKNLVCVLGLCNDSRQPYVLNEFIDGDSLKEVLKKQDDSDYLTWHDKIKLCSQTADGIAFLHSAKPMILHRDLRCANILVDKSGKTKIVDFGMTRIVQRLRKQCNGRRGCYCRPESSACPASIRWSSPEVLQNPQADESSGKYGPPSDCYSFGIVLWEVALVTDPFEDVPDEGDVIEIVLGFGRPHLELHGGWIPQYRELMKACWDQNPDNRPTMKEIAVHLKTMHHMTGRISNRKRTRTDSSTTSYLRSALNMANM